MFLVYDDQPADTGKSFTATEQNIFDLNNQNRLEGK